jgi:hypothetical protein
MWPTSPPALAAIGVRLLGERELAASVASPSGGGELLVASWRWWRNRPRAAFSFASPSALGVWRVELFGEKQSYGVGEVVTESRRGGSILLTHWTSSMTRWELGGGVDAWSDGRHTLDVAVAADQRLSADRVSVRLGGGFFHGSFRARTTSARLAWRSSVRHDGAVLLARAGIDTASAQAPRALWPGAGTGPGRDLLLRAHPLLDDGRITSGIFGRRLIHAGFEAERWLKPVLKIVRVAPAVFLDVASVDQRLARGRDWHADLGAGLRMALPGSDVIRVDIGKGLRDGSTALSAGWGRRW